MNTTTPWHRRGWLIAGAILACALSAYASEGRDDHHDDSQVKRGYELVPKGVKLNLMGKNHALVGLGSYIVNTSGCIDCHSHPSYAAGGDPFMGQPEMINATQYLSGGRQFGPFTAPNLTPDFAGKPAGLTRAQFIQLMRSGHTASGRPLQVMPWTTFGKKTDRDLESIYEYLRAIPSLPDNPNPGP